MKILKNSLFLLSAFIIYAVSGFNSVSAVDTNVTWTMDTTATEHSLIGLYEFGTGIKEVTIYMPDDIAYILDNGTDVFTINFYDEFDVLVNALDGELVFGELYPSTAYTYQFNFSVLDIDTTAVKLEFILPQTYTDSSPAAAGYIDYVNDNTTVIRDSLDTTLGLFRFYWVEDAGSANLLQSDKVYFTVGTEYISLVSSFHITGSIFDSVSLMYFYDENDILLETIYINDYITRFDEADSYLGFNIPVIEAVTNYEDISYFTLQLVVFGYTPSTLFNHNNLLAYVFDGNITNVNFYSEGEIIYSHKAVIGSIARYPGIYPTKTGEVFSHWITANGVEYNFTAIEENMLVGDDVNFYAVFDPDPDSITIIVTDPTADEDNGFTVALTSLGFNDPVERTIVFGFVAIITMGLMLWRGISVIACIVVVGLELFFFMYLGLIPAFVSILIILVLIFIGWGYEKGGAS